jgi:hypothetical protein
MMVVDTYSYHLAPYNVSSYSDLSPQSTTTAQKCQDLGDYQNRTVLPILIRTADKYSHGLDSFPPASYTGHS